MGCVGFGQWVYLAKYSTKKHLPILMGLRSRVANKLWVISLWLSFSNLMNCSGKYMERIGKMVFVGGLIVVIVFCERPTRSPVCIN